MVGWTGGSRRGGGGVGNVDWGWRGSLRQRLDLLGGGGGGLAGVKLVSKGVVSDPGGPAGGGCRGWSWGLDRGGCRGQGRCWG